jgi:excisionase family DNA binding protein
MNPLLSTDQAAAHLGVSPRYFRENYKAWGIPCLGFGHRTIKFRPEDLDAFTASQVRP